MDEFWTLLFRFSFGLLGHSFILYMMTDCRYSRRTTLWVWLGAFAATSLAIVPCILYIENINLLFIIEPFFTVAVYCAVYLLLSAGSVWRNLFIFYAYASLLMFFITLSSCVSQMFFHGSHWALVAGRTLFMGAFALWLALKKPAERLHAQPHDGETGWRSLAVFSGISSATIYITALTFMVLEAAPGIRLGVSAALFLLIGSAYLVSSHTVLLMNREREARELEAQRRLLESQLTTERAFVTQAKARRHDLQHHINLLTAYLEQGDLEGAKAYLRQYQAEMDGDTLEVFCENTVANALLRYTARRCAGSNVPFTCRAAIPQTLPLTSPELATVLGNILENAWEASRRSEAPWIAVTAQTRKNMLMLEVKNAVTGETKFEGDLPVSAKAAGGLGLHSASRALEKHGGLLHCYRTGDTFFTQVAVALR